MNKVPKKYITLLVFLFYSLPVVFAQGRGSNALPAGMQSLADSILEIFTSNFLKVILAIFLCGSAVAYAFNKDNEKVKRNCIAIGIAAAILVTATSIVGAVWSSSGG